MHFHTTYRPRFHQILFNKLYNPCVPVMQDFMPRPWPVSGSWWADHAPKQFTEFHSIYKKFSLHSKPAEVDEVVQIGFPPVLVFSRIHPVSKIFVSTISNQFFSPTVCRTSGIARPRKSPSQYTSNPSVWREARHIPCELPIMSADRLRPGFDTGQCSEMF